MRVGSIFEMNGRVFKLDSTYADDEGHIHSIVAECLTPKGNEAVWWTIEVLPDVPLAAVTVH